MDGGVCPPKLAVVQQNAAKSTNLVFSGDGKCYILCVTTTKTNAFNMCKHSTILLVENQMHTGSGRIQTDDLYIFKYYGDLFQYVFLLRGNLPALYIAQGRRQQVAVSERRIGSIQRAVICVYLRRTFKYKC